MAPYRKIKTIINVAMFAVFAVALVLVWFRDPAAADDSAFVTLRSYLDLAHAWHAADNLRGMALFTSIMFLASLIGLPPPGVIAIGGAALIGFWPAVLLALPSNTLGAMGSFSAARYLARPLVEKKFAKQLNEMKDGIAKDGAWYLFSLRLVPLVPFPLVNLTLGVTSMPLKTFALVTFFGRIPLTLLYCNAGRHIASVRSTGDILTPAVIISLAALAFAPHVLRAGLAKLERQAG